MQRYSTRTSVSYIVCLMDVGVGELLVHRCSLHLELL